MKKALKWINAGAFAAMVTVNGLANLLPIGGKTTGQISQIYPNLFTPAPITFAIWGAIYLLMLVFVIYQFGILDGGEHSTEIREKVGLWFAVSCVLNMAWIFLWHYEQIGFSTIVIVLLLGTLILINNRLQTVEGNLLERLAARAGFSLYYGWIIAATIANISVFLTQIGWSGWGLSADFWTVAVLLVGAVIAGAVAIIGRNRIAAAAVMWAYAGILLRHFSAAYYGGDHPFVIIAGLFSELLILLAILMPQIKKMARWMVGPCG